MPSRVAPRDELRALCTVLREFGRGIVEAAPRSLLGSTDGRSEDQRIYADLATLCGRPVTWGPFVPHAGGSGGRAAVDCGGTGGAGARQADPVDTLLDLALDSDLRCQFGMPIMNTDERVVAQLIRHPARILALSDAGAHVDTLADQGFTSHLLGHWVRERGALPLEEAVRLVTSVPARLFGLADRGEIRPGRAADLVVFDPASVGAQRTELVSDLPGGAARLIQRAAGVDYVLVNGEMLIDRGQQTTARSGTVLRGR